ncbi:MAG: SAM hydrolase/SAM-dependent halogenase family protein [Flavobacteriaceae bacterium]
MSLITLTTDYGSKDHFVASLKGVLLKYNPSAKIVDISHQVNQYDTLMASYIVKSCYNDFPENTVHLIAVDSSTNSEEPHIAVFADRHFFICPNKGFITQVFRPDQIESIVYINAASEDYDSFQAKNILSKAAIHLSNGGAIDLLGNPVEHIFEIKTQQVYFDDANNKLTGHFIYIDHYGNMVTNIKRIDFNARRKNRDFSIDFGKMSISRIHESYDHFNREYKKTKDASGEIFALFNSSGFLEIGLYKSNPKTRGSASTLFGLNVFDLISVQFH